MTTAASRHSRNALIFLIAAIVAALLVLPLLGAAAGAFGLGLRWACAAGHGRFDRRVCSAGGPAVLGTVAAMVVYRLFVLPGAEARSVAARLKSPGGWYCLTRARTATVTWKRLFRCLSCTWPGQAHCVEHLFVLRI